MPINAAARRDLRRLAPLPRAAPCSKESASNILSSRLKRLVAAGLLTREEATRGQRAAYSLTEAGIQTLPVMVAMGNWGLAHRDGAASCGCVPSCSATAVPS
ncbi:MAG: winged helix-turn-helix transcriptional regulator [Candidatus Limnocylindria bacterium]